MSEANNAATLGQGDGVSTDRTSVPSHGSKPVSNGSNPSKLTGRDIACFTDLFAGRADAHGDSASGCSIKTPPPYAAHLTAGPAIGVYMLMPGNVVRFAVVDVDRKDQPDQGRALAERIMEHLRVAGLTPFLERSRGKGWHVWVFFKEPMLAALVRRLLTCITARCGDPKLEVFPKQDTLEALKGGLGNYINLPYHRGEPGPDGRRAVWKGETVLTLAQFIGEAGDARHTASELTAALEAFELSADYQREPNAPAVAVEPPEVSDPERWSLVELLAAAPGWAEAHGRHDAGLILARELRNSGHGVNRASCEEVMRAYHAGACAAIPKPGEEPYSVDDAMEALRYAMDEPAKSPMWKPRSGRHAVLTGSDGLDGGAEPRHPYRETPGGLVWDKPAGEGTMAVRLANFNARITAEEALDDGVTRPLHYRITATHPNGASRETDVPAAQFDTLNWVSNLGLDYNVEPGQSVKDRLRHAIKTLSRDAARRTVYTHTGWTKCADRWLYLHADGAIGDATDGIAVQLQGNIGRYQLPHQRDTDPRAVAATIRFARLYPLITMPLAAAVFRPPLGAAEYFVYLSGETGTFKSTLAALAQQHYGRGMMDTTTLPADWSSTANYLEMLAFQAKDALLTIDEAAPGNGRYDREQLAAKQARVLRAQGNQSGRGRLTADGRLRPEHPPRGLILTTGEQPALGHSLNARGLTLELTPGILTKDAIAPCRSDGANGMYAQTLSGYIGYLADDLDTLRQDHKVRAEQWARTAFKNADAHPRTPNMLGDMLAAWEGFVRWAASIGAVSDAEAGRVVEECRDALLESGKDQARHIKDAEPTSRYLDLLTQALACGRAHLLDAQSGRCPCDNPQAHGWRRGEDYTTGSEWIPGGRRIGWLDASGVYLLKDEAFTVAQMLARDSGHDLPLDANTMSRRLKDRNRLATWDEARKNRAAIRKTFPNAGRVEVLHLREWRAEDVWVSPVDSGCIPAEIVSQVSQVSQTGTRHAKNGTRPWDTGSLKEAGVSQESAPTRSVSTLASLPDGTDGTLGTLPRTYNTAETPCDTPTPDVETEDF